jgi:6-pyruvoyltetrahydropterin/6-carboxytetrahydropterin synthase
MPHITLTRRETFSAAHRLNNATLTPEENMALYGKCNRSSGHGHNYILEVGVTGPISPASGMLMNLTDLKAVIKEHILEQLDHRNIDKDVAAFDGKPSTAENIALWIWQQLENNLPPDIELDVVKLWETEKNSVVLTRQG